MTITWHYITQPWVVIITGIALGLALARGSSVLKHKHISKRWVLFLAGLRALIILLFMLILARPEISYKRLNTQRPELLLLVDTSRSMAQSAGPGSASRLDYARSALLHGKFAEQWLSNFRIHAFAFDTIARPIAYNAIPTLQPDGADTLLADSLAAAWDFHSRDRSLAQPENAEGNRVLLLSDGIDRGSRDAHETARRLGLKVNVLAMPSSDAPEREQLAIAGIQTPGRVTLSAESRLMVTIRHSSSEDIPVLLTLSEDENQILNQPLLLPAGQPESTTSVAFRPTSAGLKSYTIAIAPKTPMPGIVVEQPRSITIRVDNRKAEALLLEDTWRWEFPFLRRIFEDDPMFAMTAFLSRGRGIYMQFGEPDRRVTLAAFPKSRPELSAFDLFVLGDVNPANWSQGFAASLRDMVVEEGKSLIVLAGHNINRLASIPALASLLPVEFNPSNAKPIEGPIVVRLSPEAADSPIFFTPPDSTWRWKNIPPLDRIYPPIRKKPAASVLLEAADHANDFGRLIVAAEHTVGRGRALVICSDSFWKWQLAAAADSQGNTPYKFFWQQALRALQPARLAFGNVQLWMQPNRTQAKIGQSVNLLMEIEADHPVTRPVIEANITLPNGNQAPLACVPSANDPTCFTADFQPALQGHHVVNAAIISEGRTLAEQTIAVDVQAMQPETEPAPPNAANLARLAAATGGSIIHPDTPLTWPPLKQIKPMVVQETKSINLWNNFALLIAITALLGLDWFLRLLRGYV